MNKSKIALWFVIMLGLAALYGCAEPAESSPAVSIFIATSDPVESTPDITASSTASVPAESSAAASAQAAASKPSETTTAVSAQAADTEPAESSPNVAASATVAEPSEAPPVVSAQTVSASDDILQKLFDEKKSDVAVSGKGTMQRLLSDDEDGDRHQRFILKLESGQTLLVAHNIDIAPRVEPLAIGDTVEFFGEYVWSKQGGTIHWTHHDPDGSHADGYLKANGKTFQ